MRPKSIVRFEQIFLAYLVLGVAGTVMLWPYRLVIFYATPGSEMFSDTLPAWVAAAGFAVQALLAWAIARWRSSTAKWIYVVLLICAGVSLVASLTLAVRPPVQISLLTAGLLVVRSIAAAMLFRIDAIDWLRR